jgi:LmbE family N-acetylglucosaminyl deacetylase
MNIVCFGAHPDDCEVFAGGTCVKWAQGGHAALLVSMTNGDIGHHEMGGGTLARRRKHESLLSAERGGVSSLVLDYHDGELVPSLEARKRVVRIIRDHAADIVLTHRPNDYHPDHRYTAQIVQDAAFMVTVPNYCPESPALKKNPVFLHLMDGFKRPIPFQADIAVDVSDVMDVKWSMLDAMESQMYEWLPWLDGSLETVPADPEARRQWMRKAWDKFFRAFAKQGEKAMVKWYGKRGAKAKYVELFEISEYGHQPSKTEIMRLFPFFPARKEDKE